MPIWLLFTRIPNLPEIGRPKGKFGKSKLDGKEEEIKLLLLKKVSKTSIAKIMGISRNALCSFISSRKLLQNTHE